MIGSNRCNREKDQIDQDWGKFISAAEDVLRGTNGFSGSYELRKRLCCASMERELHISRKIVKELLKVPKVPMERLIKWTDLNWCLSSVRRRAYLLLFYLDKRQSGHKSPQVVIDGK